MPTKSNPLAAFLVCFVYGSLSFVASFLTKKINQEYGTVNPITGMMCQTFSGIMLALFMMFGKSVNKSAFDKLAGLGIEVPHMRIVYEHSSLGFKVGMIGIVPVLFGNFALSYTSIPLYLAFRRCGLLSSVVVMYFWAGDKPSRSVVISTMLVTSGAIIAAWEDFDANLIGLLIVWAYNFS